MSYRPLATKDNASGQLNASINAASSSIVLKTGEGASFPTVYRGSTTSGGSEVTLNCTGIGATGVAINDIIENVTDGSWAVILAVSTNSLTTTRLRGGTDNTWQNADVYAVNRFMVTLVQYDTDGETILKREKVLVGNRSTDTLTVESVPSTGRGYDGSSASSYDADDYVYLFDSNALHQGIKAALVDVAKIADTALAASGTEIYGASSGGSDAYAITVTPAPTAYTAGMSYRFKADVGNTGAATLNVNGLGAVTIKKLNDQDLATGDIEANQVITVVHDGTNFQMTSQLASSFATVPQVQGDAATYAADSGSANTYAITLSPAPSAYSAGQVFQFKAANANTGSSTLNVNSIGAVAIVKNGASSLTGGEISAGQIVTVSYDGTNFQMVSWHGKNDTALITATAAEDLQVGHIVGLNSLGAFIAYADDSTGYSWVEGVVQAATSYGGSVPIILRGKVNVSGASFTAGQRYFLANKPSASELITQSSYTTYVDVNGTNVVQTFRAEGSYLTTFKVIASCAATTRNLRLILKRGGSTLSTQDISITSTSPTEYTATFNVKTYRGETLTMEFTTTTGDSRLHYASGTNPYANGALTGTGVAASSDAYMKVSFVRINPTDQYTATAPTNKIRVAVALDADDVVARIQMSDTLNLS